MSSGVPVVAAVPEGAGVPQVAAAPEGAAVSAPASAPRPANDTEPVSGPQYAATLRHGDAPEREQELVDPLVLGEAAMGRAAPKWKSAKSAPEEEELAFAPGDVFHGYVAGRRFASGGFGCLYDAVHPASPHQLYVIKVLKKRFRDPEYRTIQLKLVAEGELVRSTQQPFLVPVHACGFDDRVGAFVIMDKLDGETLLAVMTAQRRQNATFDPAVVVKMAITLAAHLHTMHRAGATHRDIKPGNIFIVKTADGSWELRIIDWGCAKSNHSPHTTLEEFALGTVAYMPREQILKQSASGAIDLYALAIIMIEMLWRHPFMEDDEVDGQGLRERQLC